MSTTPEILKQNTDMRTMSEAFVNNIVLAKFSDVLKNDFDITIKNCIKFIFLMCIMEIKSGATKSVSLAINYLLPYVTKVTVVPAFLYDKISSLCRHKQIVPMENPICDATNNRIVKINADSSFLFSLYKYIHNDARATFSKETLSININNCRDKTHAQKIDSIVVANISILNSIVYEVNVANQNPISVTIENKIVNIGSKVKITSYYDMFTKEQQVILREAYSRATAITSVATIMNRMRDYVNNITEHDVAKQIVKDNPILNIEDVTIIVGIIDCLTSCNASTNMLTSKLVGTTLFDINNAFVAPNTNANAKPYFGVMYNNYTVSKWSIWNADQINRVFKNFIESAKSLTNSAVTPVKNTTLSVSISDANPDDIQNIAYKFIEDVYEYGKSDGSRVNINYLALEHISNCTEVPNPEYKSWLEKKKMIEELSKTSVVDLSSVEVPPATIVNTSTERKISVKLLNTTSKRIDTLYLRREDKEKLVNSLEMFKNNKEIFENLGLPNKLNVLLYGEPGTGKSTAIQAIATYLNKDIYYLDLKNATTNKDLQMMFEYVNKNVANGGIIVIEDIDAMIDIVLRRDRQTGVDNVNVRDLMADADSKLSLEYLLNILQGTLTMDDSMFIVTTNYIDHLDPAFYRDGRFDVKIELKLCDHHQIRTIYKKILGRNISDDLLRNIRENTFSPATIIFHVKDYIFGVDKTDEEIMRKFLIHGCAD